MSYIDSRRSIWGVQPICEVLQFAPSTYYAAKARLASPRSLRDESLRQEITRRTFRSMVPERSGTNWGGKVFPLPAARLNV